MGDRALASDNTKTSEPILFSHGQWFEAEINFAGETRTAFSILVNADDTRAAEAFVNDRAVLAEAVKVIPPNERQHERSMLSSRRATDFMLKGPFRLEQTARGRYDALAIPAPDGRTLTLYAGGANNWARLTPGPR